MELRLKTHYPLTAHHVLRHLANDINTKRNPDTLAVFLAHHTSIQNRGCRARKCTLSTSSHRPLFAYSEDNNCEILFSDHTITPSCATTRFHPTEYFAQLYHLQRTLRPVIHPTDNQVAPLRVVQMPHKISALIL